MPLSVLQLRFGSFPAAIGKCSEDLPAITAMANRCVQRLIMAGGETGFWGGWRRVVFNISRTDPYITLPRQFARLINLDVCRKPIRIQNEFYEMLEGGPGLQTPTNVCSCDWCGALEGYERGTWPTMVDLTATNQYLRVYITDARDVSKTIVFGGATDQNGHGIYDQHGVTSVQGAVLVFEQPFATTPMIVTGFQCVMKDPTYGDILLKQVDATTGAEVLLSRYGPDETIPAYRRYYIHNLPNSCCPANAVNPSIVQVTGLAKLAYVPVSRDTDLLIIGNEEALIEEAQAIQYSTMDSPTAAQQEAKHHANALRLLHDEQRHQQGEFRPAITYAPFGQDRLSRKKIGILV